MNALEAVLRRERGVVAAGLAILTVLAWLYVWRGAGMDMSALEMTRVTLFPHLQSEPMPGMAMPGQGDPMPGMAMPGTAPASFGWLTVVAMWWVMMIAMMTPSAAPIILLYGRVLRHGAAQSQPKPVYAPSFFLAAGYLSVWLAFAGAATSAQLALQQSGLISATMLSSRSAALSGIVLIGAGAYQLSPLKHVCLEHCRGPVEFLTRHFRPGRVGALVMGARHGVWCVGCCWMLMVLLFVGGVMNLVWIALLALLVLGEKLAPRGVAVGRAAGVVLVAWGIATLVSA